MKEFIKIKNISRTKFANVEEAKEFLESVNINHYLKKVNVSVEVLYDHIDKYPTSDYKCSKQGNFVFLNTSGSHLKEISLLQNIARVIFEVRAEDKEGFNYPIARMIFVHWFAIYVICKSERTDKDDLLINIIVKEYDKLRYFELFDSIFEK